MKTFCIIVAVIAVLAISFACTAGLWYLVCWAFGIAWSWKASVGVWGALLLISSAVKPSNRKN